MKSFDEQIADIEKLDSFRQTARRLQEEAITALTGHLYVPQPRKSSVAPPAPNARRAGWDDPGDDVEKALVLRALSRLQPKGAKNRATAEASRKALIKDLTAIRYDDTTGDRQQVLDRVPIFRCAVILQALVETPGFGLSNSALVCLYQTVRELSEVTPPTWVSGAARAGGKATATTFVTGECVRGILALRNCLLQTAQAATLLGKEAARIERGGSILETWSEQERKFRQASLDVSLGVLKPNLLVEFSARALRNGPEALLGEIAATLGEVSAITGLKLPRAAKTRAATGTLQAVVQARYEEAARDIAWHTLDRLLSALKVDPSRDPKKLAENLSKSLNEGAQVLQDVLEPVEHFAESVVDQQLAASSVQLNLWVDGAELVFGAALLGLVSDWTRPKVRAAFELVRPLLSANGRLLSLKPFDVSDKGYRLNVATIEVTRRLADLVERLDVEPEPDFVERLMRPFEYTRVGGSPSQAGWMTDPPERRPNSVWWLTAVVVEALDSVTRMLDEAINRQVLRHFQVRTPASLSLGLDDLFYPDYGLARTGQDSIAVKLQGIRAHAGAGPVQAKPTFSLILYGPPGTGKTTLVEAVARTAGVPLVEVTPSDILVGGAEGVERRTRQVFRALSKLTHVVILFDEFDSILLDRSKRDPDDIPTSVIEFLTPGMLPKLKALNDASKKQRISYLLATNFVSRLDSAVTRAGRFDDKHGIYPPDVMSRMGRVLDQLALVGKAPTALTTAQRKRVLKAVAQTRSRPMEKLGKPGWFTAPREPGAAATGSLFKYVLDGTKLAPIEKEADYVREKQKKDLQDKARAEKQAALGTTTAASTPAKDDQYWRDWKTIADWDSAFKDKASKLKTWKEAREWFANLKGKP